MAKIITKPLLLLFFFCFFQSKVRGHEGVVSDLYVFGDSVMDPGNNIFLDTYVKLNFLPNGIDFPKGPTGRFTNGNTIADFWYTWSNPGSTNPIPLPYMDPLSRQNPNTHGFNFASGTSGILPETNRNVGENLALGKQVQLFRQAVQQYLSSLMEEYNKNTDDKLLRVLSKSIFVICIGSNDFMNYLQKGSNTSKLYNPKQFGEFLLNELGNHVQELYKLGARRFVVFDIGPLGCLPSTIDKTKPSILCDEKINGYVSLYNNNLGPKVNELSFSLKGSMFVIAKSYKLIYDIVHNPLQYGFTDSRHACCASGIDGTGDCQAGQAVCQNRSSYVFWDTVHPTEALYRQIASKCFNGTGLCTPMNFVQLAEKA